MTDPDRTLLDYLPDGDVQYVRAPSGMWDVALYECGTTKRIRTLAHDMDKTVACFVAQAITTAKVSGA